MGGDADFYWRMKRLARRRRGVVGLPEDVRVAPSTRRFDQWGLWRTPVWAEPHVHPAAPAEAVGLARLVQGGAAMTSGLMPSQAASLT